MANSKQLEHSNRGFPSVDRISALPETLLCHILSRFPTHYAVQTSVLSKRWKHLWTSITSLDFDDELFTYPAKPPYDRVAENKRFDQFVYRVLLLLKTPCLLSFRLRCLHVCDPFLVSSWAYAALSRDIREFILIAHISEPFEIPNSLFTCKTLSYLELDCDTTLDVPNSVCLPNLKFMDLTSVTYANDETILKLLSGCLALEELYFRRTELDNVVHFSISSPTLKYLHLYFESDIELDSPRHTLQIDAPLLQYLRLDDQISNEFIIGNLSSLIEADISVYVNERNNDDTGYGNEVLKLINGLSNVEFLKLSGATMKVLSYARGHAVPVLRNLTGLQGSFRFFKKPWSFQPDHVPKYLLSLLTTVDITSFDGSEDELMMVKFILSNAKSLERMTIITSPRQEAKLELLQRISTFPMGSKHCEVVVV